MTDQQIIQAATSAGLCFPQCWALEMEQEDWGEQEHSQMAKLRYFAELLKDL